MTTTAPRMGGPASLPGQTQQAPAEPTHPRWTHVPVGGVVIVAGLDVMSLAGHSRPWAHELYRAGTFVLMVASAAMVVAIGTGLVDRARIRDDRVRNRVNKHAALMDLMAGVALMDLALRRLVHADAQRTPGIVLAMSLLALALSLVGGDLGGRLTYRLGVGVRPQREDRQA